MNLIHFFIAFFMSKRHNLNKRNSEVKQKKFRGETTMLRFLILTAMAMTTMVSSVWASSGSSSKPLAGTYPIILSHGLFGWGENSGGVISIVNYWGGMDDYLRSQGATVYAPGKSAANSNELRAGQLKSLNFKLLLQLPTTLVNSYFRSLARRT